MATSPGADAPKWSMHTVASAYRSHPNEEAASTASRGTPVGEHLAPVVVGLVGEQLPRRERHHPGGDAVRGQLVGGGQAELDLAAGADEDDPGRAAVRVAQHVGAAGHALGGQPGRVGQDGERLAGQDEGGGTVAVDGDAPGLGRLVGVGRPDHPQAGHGPHGGQLLDGLVGGAVLAQADGVVGPRVDDVHVGQGGQPHGAPHVVAEHEEGARPPGRMPRWAAMPVMTPPMPCSRIP